MDSITTIPSTEITTNDKKGEIENLRPSSKTPFKSSEEKLVIEYVPTKTRPIANVELVSTDNVKTYTVQFFNADGTVTTKKVKVGEKATSVGTKPDVRKVNVIITQDDKEDSYKPVQLQLSVHACFEVTSTSIPSTTTVPHTSSTGTIKVEITPVTTSTPTISSETTTSSTGNCDAPLGLESGLIPSSNIKYSTADNDSGYGRLNQTPWVSKKGFESGSYIEVLFHGQIGAFSKINFQGGSINGIGSGYVTSFKIEVREQNGNWKPVKGVFKGSQNADTVISKRIYPMANGDGIRIYPLTWFSRPLFRFELFGCMFSSSTTESLSTPLSSEESKLHRC
ncbi:venom prothrombin activator pseutarin-C non-catalytic subunit-like [Mytilus trossulus]|uniref:venom prothrombin activator pseutarin-C non-catalytic subunit-like n=1 Tax=Mytilus trossulus TaxID=6551 RepID=UPI0030070713